MAAVRYQRLSRSSKLTPSLPVYVPDVSSWPQAARADGTIAQTEAAGAIGVRAEGEVLDGGVKMEGVRTGGV